MNVNPDSCYKISFYHAYHTEPYQDGGAVEFSQDGGQTWTSIGSPGANWYNEWYIIGLSDQSPGNPGWTGTSNGWEYAERTVKFPQAGTTIVRWRFGADFSVQSEGWAIDDICIENVGACTPTAVEEAPPSIQVGLWPNPTADKTVLNIELGRAETFSWSIVNGLGELVMQGAEEGQIGSNTVSIDVQDLANGIYYVDVQVGDSKTMRKLIITK